MNETARDATVKKVMDALAAARLLRGALRSFQPRWQRARPHFRIREVGTFAGLPQEWAESMIAAGATFEQARHAAFDALVALGSRCTQ